MHRPASWGDVMLLVAAAAVMVTIVVPSVCLGQCFPALVACYNRISLESEKVPVMALHPRTIILDANDEAPTLPSFTSSSEHS